MDKVAFNIGNAYNAPIRAGDPGPIIANLLVVAYTVAGVILLFMIVYTGFDMVKSAGSNSPDDVARNKKRMTMAVTGLLIVFTSFWIIRFIELVSGSNFITQPTI